MKISRGWKWGLAGLSLLLIVSLVFKFYGLGSEKASAYPSTIQIENPSQIVVAEQVRLPYWYVAVGTVHPWKETTLSAEVSAQVRRILVREGSFLREGDVLAELDDQVYASQLEQAKSMLQSAEAVLENETLAYERGKQLFDTAVISKTEFEDTTTQFYTAQANVAAARERVREAALRLDDTRIYAPFDCVVSQRMVDEGDFVAPGKGLFSVYSPEKLRLEANVREGIIGRVRVDQTLPLIFDALEWETEGVVKELIPSGDPKSRSFTVKVEIPERAGLYPGMFGKLKVELGRRLTVLIPKEAIKRVGQLTTVLVKVNDRWERRYVTTGQSYGDNVEVLSGLHGGETIGYSDGEGAND